MQKHIIALLIFFVAVVLLFITIMISIEEPQYLDSEQVKSELNI